MISRRSPGPTTTKPRATRTRGSPVGGSVSRVLCPRPVAEPRGAIIHLGRASPRASSGEPEGLGRTTLERLPIPPCSGWGLPCDRRYRRPGELLPRRFTLTERVRGAQLAPRLPEPSSAVCFLLHCPRGHPHQPLTGILSCGARTFLPLIERRRVSAGALPLRKSAGDRSGRSDPRGIARPAPPQTWSCGPCTGTPVPCLLCAGPR